MNYRVTTNLDLAAINGKVERAIGTGLAACGTAVRTDAKASMGSMHGGKPSAPGSPPNRQQGALSRSISSVVEGRTARVGSNLAYARIQEKGGTIRPRNGRFLWVPINARAGETPTAVRNDKKNFAFIPRRAGGWFVVRKSKSGRKTKRGLLYVLIHGTNLAARPYLAPALGRVAPRMSTIFAKAAGSNFMAGVTQ